MSAPKFTFTPGPWTLMEKPPASRDDHGWRIIATTRIDGLVVMAPKDAVLFVEAGRVRRNVGNDRADANLIAAAPDLYASLETMERRYVAALGIIRTLNQTPPSIQPDPETSLIVKEARAALAKARGETT